MTSERIKERGSPLRTANRIYRLAKLFLKENPNQESKEPLLVFQFTFNDNSEVPEPKNYNPNDPVHKLYRNHNESVRRMKTSVISKSYYYVANGENDSEIKVILRYTKIDKGYKIPTIEIKDDNDVSRVSKWVEERINMTDEDIKLEKIKDAFESEVLLNYEKILIIDKELLKLGRIRFIFNDILNQKTSEEDFDLNNPEINPDFSGAEFNLLSQLMQKFKEHTLPQELKPEGFAILKDFFGKRLPAFDNW